MHAGHGLAPVRVVTAIDSAADPIAMCADLVDGIARRRRVSFGVKVGR
jgi:hypothetical protein